jgi:hypothetical protein
LEEAFAPVGLDLEIFSARRRVDISRDRRISLDFGIVVNLLLDAEAENVTDEARSDAKLLDLADRLFGSQRRAVRRQVRKFVERVSGVRTTAAQGDVLTVSVFDRRLGVAVSLIVIEKRLDAPVDEHGPTVLLD